MEQLRFVFKETRVRTKATARTKSHADVGVIYSNDITKGERITLTFRNDSWKKIAPHTSTIAWAISGDRLYFQEAPEKVGYKLSKVRDGENKYLQLSGKKRKKELKWAKKHSGQYALNWDEARNLYYINAEELQFITMIGGEAL
jgi:hypothetical protein